MDSKAKTKKTNRHLACPSHLMLTDCRSNEIKRFQSGVAVQANSSTPIAVEWTPEANRLCPFTVKMTPGNKSPNPTSRTTPRRESFPSSSAASTSTSGGPTSKTCATSTCRRLVTTLLIAGSGLDLSRSSGASARCSDAPSCGLRLCSQQRPRDRAQTMISVIGLP